MGNEAAKTTEWMPEDIDNESITVSLNPDKRIRIVSVVGNDALQARIKHIPESNPAMNDEEEAGNQVEAPPPGVVSSETRFVICIWEEKEKKAKEDKEKDSKENFTDCEVLVPDDECVLFEIPLLQLQVPFAIRQQIFREVMQEVMRLSDKSDAKRHTIDFASFLYKIEKGVPGLPVKYVSKSIENLGKDMEKEFSDHGEKWLEHSINEKIAEQERELIAFCLNRGIFVIAEPQKDASDESTKND